MTRADEIQRLRARYLVAMAEHRHKEAAILYARLQSLVTRQIRAEIRADKKSVAA